MQAPIDAVKIMDRQIQELEADLSAAREAAEVEAHEHDCTLKENKRLRSEVADLACYASHFPEGHEVTQEQFIIALERISGTALQQSKGVEK